MKNVNNNQKGFSAVEVLLIFIIIILIGAVGWLVYENHHKTSTTTNATASSTSTTRTKTSNPYAGWKSYTLKYEQASFKYPSKWTIKPTSGNGSDSVILTGAHGFSVIIETGGLGHPTSDGPDWVLEALPVTFLGKSGYVDYTSTQASSSDPNQSNNLVSQISLSQSPTDFLDTFPSKATGENDTPGGNFIISANYFVADSNGNNSVPDQTLAKAEADPNYYDTILLIKSMKY